MNGEIQAEFDKAVMGGGAIVLKEPDIALNYNPYLFIYIVCHPSNTGLKGQHP